MTADEDDDAVRDLLLHLGIDPDRPISEHDAAGRLIPPERIPDYLASLDD